MPDRDLFSRIARPGWASALRSYSKVNDASTMVRCTTKALAREIRQGGVPSLPELVRTANELINHTASLEATVQRLSRIQLAYPGLNDKLAIRALKGLIVSGFPNGGRQADIEIARSTVKELIEYHVFGRRRPELMTSTQHLPEWDQDCRTKLHPVINASASRILRDPTGSAFRAPATAQQRVPTSELLDEEME